MAVSMSWHHLATRDSGKPHTTTTIRTVDKCFRIHLPRRLNLVAGKICDAHSSAAHLIAQPQIPNTTIEPTVGHPVCVRRKGGVPGLSQIEWHIGVRCVCQIYLRWASFVHSCERIVLGGQERRLINVEWGRRESDVVRGATLQLANL